MKKIVFLQIVTLSFLLLAQEENLEIETAKNKNNVLINENIRLLLSAKEPRVIKSILQNISPEALAELLETKINGIQNIVIAYLQMPHCQDQSCKEHLVQFLSVPMIREYILHRTSATDNALYAALVEGRVDEANLLIDHGMDLNKEVFKSKKTIFMSLIESNPEMAEQIAKRHPNKINWHQQSIRGESAHSLWKAWKASLTPKLFHHQEDL